MRLSFSDGSRLKAQARRNRESGLAIAKRWWVQKHQTPTRPFLDMSLPGLLIEMYEDMLATRDEIMDELATRRGDKSDLYERLAAINKVMADDDAPSPQSYDPLIDKWDREMEEGKDPDLDEQWIG